MIRRSLARSIYLRLLPWLVALAITPWLLAAWTGSWQLAALCALLELLLVGWLLRGALAPLHAVFRALSGSVNSYRDGEYNFGVRWESDDELGELVRSHGELGEVLREQRQALAQRELLLDTMVQQTPVAMLLVAPGGDGARRVVYANLAARQLLYEGRRLEGQRLDQLLPIWPAPLREALQRAGDSLFAVPDSDTEEQIYHLARREFRIDGRRHELLLLRLLTAELRRQEVRTWKKVIRVISHELNNSLAPIASLANSGAELVRRGQTDRLSEVFATIEERARHLEGFIQGYARFAKLPQPQLRSVDCVDLLSGLQRQVRFEIESRTPVPLVRLDVAQIQQALLNLLTNAHEASADGAAADICVRVTALQDWIRFEVLDRGPGMSGDVLQNALLPFYSTKRNGTGLGLALAREIAEAHGGHLSLRNRHGGGLNVLLQIPAGNASGDAD